MQMPCAWETLTHWHDEAVRERESQLFFVVLVSLQHRQQRGEGGEEQREACPGDRAPIQDGVAGELGTGVVVDRTVVPLDEEIFAAGEPAVYMAVYARAQCR